MLYTPPAFRETDLDRLHDTIADTGLATLITQSDDGPIVSHIPLSLDRNAGDKGTLIGHVARGNPQWKASDLSKPALAIFLGPDAYISPSWYPSKKRDPRAVPSWNYVAIHARGRFETFDDPEELRAILTHLTDEHEGRVGTPWKVTDAPVDYLGKLLKAIVGVRLVIETIEGKFKLSQNRLMEDREGVITALQGAEGEAARETAALMQRAMQKSD